jgi:hypothetical protein
MAKKELTKMKKKNKLMQKVKTCKERILEVATGESEFKEQM